MFAAFSLFGASASAQYAFIYQGKLDDTTPGGLAATYDFEFRLFDDATIGGPDVQFGSPITRLGVPVANGTFSTDLDFGIAVFNGRRVWLQIAVRRPSAPAFTTLIQRQELTSAPYALAARSLALPQLLTTNQNLAAFGITNTGTGASIYGSGTTVGVSAIGGTQTVGLSPGFGSPVGVLSVGYGPTSYGVWAASTTGTGISTSSQSGTGLTANSGSGNAARFFGNVGNFSDIVAISQPAVAGHALTIDSPNAAFNTSLLYATSNSTDLGACAVNGILTSTSATGVAVRGDARGTGSGVYGTATNGYGVQGYADGDTFSRGVSGNSVNGSGVFGTSTNGNAGKFVLFGDTNGNAALFAETQSRAGNSAAISGLASDPSNGTSVLGVRGEAFGNGIGVFGLSSSGYGGYFSNSSSATTIPALYANSGSGQPNAFALHAVLANTAAGSFSAAVRAENLGTGGNGVGVYATHNGSGYGLYASAFNAAGYAGYFVGRCFISGALNINGTLTKGGGSFKIDHPLDPEHKFLSHSFVESPDMKNIYDGVVTTDDRGRAEVMLPDWFDALNRDFRYQLTVIGGGEDGEPFPQVRVVEKIAGNRFVIRSSAARVEVSWQVTGTRKDAWANANRIPVEEDKSVTERGKYLHPASFGLPLSRGMESTAEQPASGAANASGAKQSGSVEADS
jgi:hypothetical protein